MTPVQISGSLSQRGTAVPEDEPRTDRREIQDMVDTHHGPVPLRWPALSPIAIPARLCASPTPPTTRFSRSSVQQREAKQENSTRTPLSLDAARLYGRRGQPRHHEPHPCRRTLWRHNEGIIHFPRHGLLRPAHAQLRPREGDNQHRAKDIKKCSETMVSTGNVVLGVRDFTGDDVPARSKFGNNMTSGVFKVLCRLNISDTQTGLRAIPYKYLETFDKVEGERFEYETNMLLAFKKSIILDFRKNR